MKHLTLFFAAVLLLCTTAGFVSTPMNDSYPEQGIPRLYVTGTEMAGKAVLIKYDITYAGFVELHLFNQEGDKVWIKGRVVDKVGSHVFPVPRKPLDAGARYSFIIKYKGKEYSGSFYTDS